LSRQNEFLGQQTIKTMFISTPKQKRNKILIEKYGKIEICVGKNILHVQSFEPLT
jgi:hypothetical protein